jgi:glutaredoxin-related protein
MAKVVPPAYPEALTVKFWDKAKGVLARISKVKTGITEELEKAKAEFDKVDWAELQTNEFLTRYRRKQGAMFPEEAESLFRQYLEVNHPRFKKLEATFSDLSSFLKKKASTFEADPKTEKFAKAVLVMADAANKFTYAVAFGTVSSANQAEWTKVREEAVKIEQQWKDARAGIKTLILDAEKAVKSAISKKVNLAGYNKMWSQNLRGIGAQVVMGGLKDEFAPAMNRVKKEWSQSGLPSKESDVAPQLERDLEHVIFYKKLAAKVLGD